MWRFKTAALQSLAALLQEGGGWGADRLTRIRVAHVAAQGGEGGEGGDGGRRGGRR